MALGASAVTPGKDRAAGIGGKSLSENRVSFIREVAGQASRAPIGSGAYFIDFLEAHDGLSTELCYSPKSSDARREICEIAACQRRAIELTDRLEQCLYWLISAAAFAVLGIVGLQELKSPRMDLFRFPHLPSARTGQQVTHGIR